MEKYKDLKKEIRRLWKLRNVEIVPVVIETFGSVSTEFKRWMGKLGITCNVGVMQKTPLLGTAKILSIGNKKYWKCKDESILLAFGHLLRLA